MSESRFARFAQREELLEQAAQASRAGLRTRRERMLSTYRPILQTAVAAAVAWLVAKEVVDHYQPFFAPVAAVITLGLTVGERRRRAVEIAVGVALGIFIADVLVYLMGSGGWQIAVIVGLAMAGATLVGGGPLLASQAGISAVLVVTLQPTTDTFSFERFVDALIGSGIALAAGSLLFPIDPLRLVRGATAPLLERLADALGRIAAALETREEERADEALAAVARLDGSHDELLDALESAGEVARLSPRRRGALGRLDRYALAGGELGLAVENVRALARAAVRVISVDDSIPPEAVQAIRELSAAVHALAPYLAGGEPDEARAAAIRAAGLANAVLEETGNLSAVHTVGQIRLTAVDLLRAAGMERHEAQQEVRSAYARLAHEPA
jgi:uncharacterized membrane protein YgaE (UPF0421/DUF939 family)